MPLILPETLDALIQPVFDALSHEQAMCDLIVKSPGNHPEAAAKVQEAVTDPALAIHPGVVAGLWLYVDELDKAHEACQDLETPTGSFWHAVMHRREGDFSNSKYWYRKAGSHPAMSRIDLTGGGAGSGTSVAEYDPFAFVDRVQRAAERGDDSSPALESMQNKEWQALFKWCLDN